MIACPSMIMLLFADLRQRLLSDRSDVVQVSHCHCRPELSLLCGCTSRLQRPLELS